MTYEALQGILAVPKCILKVFPPFPCGSYIDATQPETNCLACIIYYRLHATTRQTRIKTICAAGFGHAVLLPYSGNPYLSVNSLCNFCTTCLSFVNLSTSCACVRARSFSGQSRVEILTHSVHVLDSPSISICGHKISPACKISPVSGSTMYVLLDVRLPTIENASDMSDEATEACDISITKANS